MTIDIETLRFKTQLNKLDNSQMVLSPLVVSELLDRLEEAEKAWKISDQTVYDLTEKVIPNIQKKFEAAENGLETERMRLAACSVAALGYFDGCAEEYTSASLDDVLNLRKRLEATEKERDELRAKVAEMEKQEPVAHVWRCDNGHIHGSCESELLMGQQLYALPGAKGEKDV